MSETPTTPARPKLLDRLRHFGSPEHEQRSTFVNVLHYGWLLVVHTYRQLIYDRATQMSAALTYRTIFSLVPMLLLALVVFRAFGGFQEMQQEFRQHIYSYLNLDAIQNTASSEPGRPDPGANDVQGKLGSGRPGSLSEENAVPQTAPAETSSIIKSRVDEMLNNVVNQASNLSFKSIGAIGFVLLIWAALALIVEVETAFNYIYNAPIGRAWHMRITIYWGALTLGPVLIFASIYTTGRLLELAEQFMGPAGLLFTFVVGQVAALLFSWLLLLMLYQLLPNAKIEFRAALVGSFVAAILWELGKRGFQWYVAHSVSYSKLYGSLGMIPLFLLWVYLTWFIVLFGLELTYSLQTLRTGRLLEKDDATHWPLGDGRWLIVMLVYMAKKFTLGKSVDIDELTGELGLPSRVVRELCLRAESAGLIHRIKSRDAFSLRYALAKPAEQISMTSLLDVIDTIARGPANAQPNHHDPHNWQFVDRLLKTDRTAAEGISLANLLK